MGLAAYASRVRGPDGTTEEAKPPTASKWKGKEKDDSKLPPWKRLVFSLEFSCGICSRSDNFNPT